MDKRKQQDSEGKKRRDANTTINTYGWANSFVYVRLDKPPNFSQPILTSIKFWFQLFTL